MPKTALILFAHGSRDPEWPSPLRRVRSAILTSSLDLRVELAFLEFLPPTLQECAAIMISEGFDRIIVVPMFIAQGGHLKNDVPLLMDELRNAHPDVRFVLSPPVGEAEPIVQAMAGYALGLAGSF